MVAGSGAAASGIFWMIPRQARKDGAQAPAPGGARSRSGGRGCVYFKIVAAHLPRDCHLTLGYELGWAGTALFPASEKRKPFQPIRHKAQRQHLA